MKNVKEQKHEYGGEDKEKGEHSHRNTNHAISL